MAQGIWTPGGGFDRQPQGPVGVDWANPISMGLISAGTPFGDVITGQGTLYTSAAISDAPNRFGRGINYNQNQIDWFKSGSALNLIRKQQA